MEEFKLIMFLLLVPILGGISLFSLIYLDRKHNKQ
jgi:hypothetical protein